MDFTIFYYLPLQSISQRDISFLLFTFTVYIPEDIAILFIMYLYRYYTKSIYVYLDLIFLMHVPYFTTSNFSR